MKLIMRNSPPHLGQVRGFTSETLRMRRAQARPQWRRKSSCPGSGEDAGSGVMSTGSGWEWVADWYDLKPGGVTKSGSWFDAWSSYLYFAYRESGDPTEGTNDRGLRCVREISGV
jgi:hypothetical protein